MVENADRAQNGRFVKGHSVKSPGRPRREDEETIKAALDAAMPAGEVVAKLRECVARRESWAVSLWLAYRWGKPRERLEADVMSGGKSLADLQLAILAKLEDAGEDDAPANLGR